MTLESAASRRLRLGVADRDPVRGDELKGSFAGIDIDAARVWNVFGVVEKIQLARGVSILPFSIEMLKSVARILVSRTEFTPLFHDDSGGKGLT